MSGQISSLSRGKPPVYSEHPDMSKERGASTCDVDELALIMCGGAEYRKRKKFIESHILSDPVFADEDRYYLNNSEIIDVAIKRNIRWCQLQAQYSLSDEDMQIFYLLYMNDLSFGIHDVMFQPTIKRLATSEQLAKWWPLVESKQILGTYAQTELAHGTYLNGLETTATFDKEAQEFVLNTPSHTSMKWWPGSLGVVVNYAVVLAQLVIDGQKCGIQAFLVQLRDRDTHQPMPGCQLGDIGLKWNTNGISNGYLILDHVRIPRDQMLMKYIEVTPDGYLLSHGNPKVTYGTMIEMRCNIVMGSAGMLAMAVTIAIRYSAIRRQGSIDKSDGEVQILDYQSQQDKLFPALATAYGFLFFAKRLRDIYIKAESLISAEDFSRLPELHAISCGLKAFCCDMASQYVDTCRYACGGHGYLLASGLPWIYERCSVLSTAEGEKTVLYMQTARYLLKMVDYLQKGGTLPENCFDSYLSQEMKARWRPGFKGQVRDYGHVIDAFQHRVQRKLQKTSERLQALTSSGLSKERAWNESQVLVVQAAEAHVQLFCVQAFYGEVQNQTAVSAGTKNVMNQLSLLFSLNHIQKNSGDFLEDGFMSGQQLDWVNEEYLQLLAEIRPEAVTLVDAFEYPDISLQSVLGCYDGRVYERLYDSTKKEARNERAYALFHKYLHPFMKANSKL